MKESDLYEPVKEHFSDLGYSIYAEVEVPFCGGRVDVIAFNRPGAIAIELKNSLSFDLIEQAIKRKNVFPLVYIAYPKKKAAPAMWLQKYFFEQGIGVLEVSRAGKVNCLLKARYKKPFIKKTKWENILRPEHQEWVPGGHAGGGYVTNYAITMKGVRHHLSQARKHGSWYADDGWRSVAEILQHCETHYATPKNSLGKALENFEFDWCERKKENGRLYYRHKG